MTCQPTPLRASVPSGSRSLTCQPSPRRALVPSGPHTTVRCQPSPRWASVPSATASARLVMAPTEGGRVSSLTAASLREGHNSCPQQQAGWLSNSAGLLSLATWSAASAALRADPSRKWGTSVTASAHVPSFLLKNSKVLSLGTRK